MVLTSAACEKLGYKTIHTRYSPADLLLIAINWYEGSVKLLTIVRWPLAGRDMKYLVLSYIVNMCLVLGSLSLVRAWQLGVVGAFLCLNQFQASQTLCSDGFTFILSGLYFGTAHLSIIEMLIRRCLSEKNPPISQIHAMHASLDPLLEASLTC